jgi:hypothetical protein
MERSTSEPWSQDHPNSVSLGGFATSVDCLGVDGTYNFEVFVVFEDAIH